jgi:hypothetical protein
MSVVATPKRIAAIIPTGNEFKIAVGQSTDATSKD